MLLLRLALWGPPFWFGTLRVQCTLRVHACLLYCLSLTWMAPFCYGLYCGAAILIYRTLGVQCILRVQACCLLYCLSLTWGPPFWFTQRTLSVYPMCTPSAPTHNACSWLATNITWQSGCSLYIMAQMGRTMVFIMTMMVMMIFAKQHKHMTDQTDPRIQHTSARVICLMRVVGLQPVCS